MQNRVLCLSFLESTSGFARKIENDLRKQVFGSQHENYLTDFQNSNGILSGLMKVIYKNVVAENQLPVWTGNSFLFIK